MIEAASALLVLATLPATLELLLVSVGVLFYKARPLSPLQAPVPKTAVLVPAHNEASQIQATLRTIQACAGDYDCVVIADNCTDRTAAIAEEEKALVLKRESPERGKHHALRFAFEKFPDYDLYIIVDADSVVQPNLVSVLQQHIQEGRQAVQAAYLLPQQGESPSTRIGSIAFAAFNVIRPMGRSAWDLSCGIFGNGFALKREVVETVPFPTDTIVEDAAYHIKLIEKGIKVAFTRETAVTAEHPADRQAADQQQRRWQGGRLRLWLAQAPALLKRLLQGQWECLEPLLDLSTPPLAYTVFLLLILLWTPFKGYAFFAFCILAIHLAQTLTYRKAYGKDLQALLSVPFYLAKKLLSLGSVLKGSSARQTWERTKRKGE